MSQTLTTQRGATQTTVGQRGAKRGPTGKLLSRIPLWVLIVLLLIVELYPLLWLLLSSFKTSDEFATGAFWSFPAGLDWQNYADAWTAGLSTYFLNSILTAFTALFLILLLSLAARF